MTATYLLPSCWGMHLIPKWPLIYAHTNWPLLPRSRENILLNFKLKNEASRVNLNIKRYICLNGGHCGIRCIGYWGDEGPGKTALTSARFFQFNNVD